MKGVRRVLSAVGGEEQTFQFCELLLRPGKREKKQPVSSEQ